MCESFRGAPSNRSSSCQGERRRQLSTVLYLDQLSNRECSDESNFNMEFVVDLAGLKTTEKHLTAASHPELIIKVDYRKRHSLLLLNYHDMNNETHRICPKRGKGNGLLHGHDRMREKFFIRFVINFQGFFLPLF